MKRISLAVLLSAAVVLSLSACDASKDTESGHKDVSDSRFETKSGGIGEDPIIWEKPEQKFSMWEILPEIPVTDESCFTYEFDEKLGGTKVTGYTGESLAVRIPDTLGGKTVVGVDLMRCEKNLTELIMPDSVKIFNLGGSSSSAGSNIDRSLQYVNIPLNARSDGEDYDLETYADASDETVFYEIKFVFADYRDLKGVYIPEGIREIRNNAFYGCVSLENITIPDSVTKIGESAFYECTNLKNVNIPDGVTEIRGSAFKHCTSLEKVEIPDSVTDLLGYAFSGCTALSEITIGDNVTSIYVETFCGCTSLTSITIPHSVTVIDANSAFMGCTNLTDINVDESNPNYCSIDGMLCKKSDGEIVLDYCPGGKGVDIVIPRGITGIGDKAFSNIEELVSVTIPEGVTEINDRIFFRWGKLESVIIPDSVTRISDNAFLGSENITAATYKGHTYDYEHIDDLYAAINGG